MGKQPLTEVQKVLIANGGNFHSVLRKKGSLLSAPKKRGKRGRDDDAR